MGKKLKMFTDKHIQKMNIGSWYINKIYLQAIQYANQKSNIKNMNEILDIIYKNQNQYSTEMSTFLDREIKETDKRYEEWEYVGKIKNLCKWITILLIIISAMTFFLQNKNICKYFFASFLILGIITIILLLIVANKKKTYYSYINKIGTTARFINEKYQKDADTLWKTIDDMYLNSLEPVFRETVLMRRDQERQHQERIMMQQKILSNQKRAEESQKQLNQMQRQLLDIEREREERYNKYRY